MTAYELADKLQMDKAKALLYVDTVVQSAEMLRQQADRLAKYEQVLQSIANEQVELSHDKIKWQCEDHIRWAREALSLSGNNAEYVGNTNETLPKGSQTKPLSDEEIMDIAEQSDYSPLEIEMGYDYEIRIARAIEERHGIK